MILKFGSGSQLIPVLDRPRLKTSIEVLDILPGSSKGINAGERVAVYVIDKVSYIYIAG
jgi:hypothetical protein